MTNLIRLTIYFDSCLVVLILVLPTFFGDKFLQVNEALHNTKCCRIEA